MSRSITVDVDVSLDEWDDDDIREEALRRGLLCASVAGNERPLVVSWAQSLEASAHDPARVREIALEMLAATTGSQNARMAAARYEQWRQAQARRLMAEAGLA